MSAPLPSTEDLFNEMLATPAILIELSPSSALTVIGALQLAIRHPSFPRDAREILVAIIKRMQLGPLARCVIAAGFDPAHDTITLRA